MRGVAFLLFAVLSEFSGVAQAAPGFAVGQSCYATKLEAAEAVCRESFPLFDTGTTLSSGSTTANTWQLVQSCVGVTGTTVPYLNVARSQTTTTTATWNNYLLRMDNFPSCDTDDMPTDPAFYAVAGVGVLLFFSLMHGFSVGRGST